MMVNFVSTSRGHHAQMWLNINLGVPVKVFYWMILAFKLTDSV